MNRNPFLCALTLHVAALAGLLLLPLAGAVETKPEEPLLELNQLFRAAYARARQETLAKTGPVVLVEGDNLVLLRQGKRTEARVIPERYHTLKAAAHAPLACYVLLVPAGDGALSAERLTEIRRFAEQLAVVLEKAPGRGLTEAQLHRQRQLLSASRDFLNAALREQKFKTEDATAFTRRMGPLVLAHAADAAQAQIDALHQQMTQWKGEMTEEEWKQFRVIIQGSALPRKGNLAVQFFARLLDEKGEGKRIVYAESIYDEERALKLLGTSILDTGVGMAFFDDPQRMHRDLLADAAAEYLKTVKWGTNR